MHGAQKKRVASRERSLVARRVAGHFRIVNIRSFSTIWSHGKITFCRFFFHAFLSTLSSPSCMSTMLEAAARPPQTVSAQREGGVNKTGCPLHLLWQIVWKLPKGSRKSGKTASTKIFFRRATESPGEKKKRSGFIAVRFGHALPGFLITAPPSVCVPDVIDVRAVWISNQKKKGFGLVPGYTTLSVRVRANI